MIIAGIKTWSHKKGDVVQFCFILYRKLKNDFNRNWILDLDKDFIHSVMYME